MLDRWDCALGNVRIDSDLRRRRNDNGSRDVGNVDVVGNISDVGNVDKFRDTGDVGIVGNVRFRLEQHCIIVDAKLNVAHNSGRGCSNGNSVGIFRDRQSRGQLRSSRTNNDRIAHCGANSGGASRTDGYISECRLTFCDKPVPMPEWQRRRNVKPCERLLK